MRFVALLPLVLAGVGLLVPVAYAQTEDEKILEQSAETPARSQSKADDEMDDEDLDAQVFYSGMGVERVSTDFNNLGEATNLAVVLGFRIPTASWFGLEIDIGQTLIPGEYKDPDPGAPACNPPPFETTPLGCVPGGRPAEAGAFDADAREFGMQALMVDPLLQVQPFLTRLATVHVH